MNLPDDCLFLTSVVRKGKKFIAVPFEYHAEVEVEISDIANLGMGIGRVNNWVVMVPHVCIGEVVVARIYKNLKNYSLGDLVRVINPSVDRVSPACGLFGICGGCQYQHMRYPAQLSLKRHQVADAMLRMAGIDMHVNDCIGGDQQYNYRTKITPHFQKTVPPIGFLGAGGNGIVDVEHCAIATENINRELSRARDSVFGKRDSLKRGGTLLLRDIGSEVVTNPKAMVSQIVGDFEFSFSAGEFFQNNGNMLPKLIDFVVASAMGPRYLVDAYCGVGVFGIIAAASFDGVVGIEISAIAASLARQNAAKNDVANVEFVTGFAEKIFENIKFLGGDASVIVDPPRSGCDTDFLRQLMAFAPQKIVYVSCAPDTQARDLKILCEDYSPVEIQPFDMFPQTRHVENVVTLKRRDLVT